MHTPVRYIAAAYTSVLYFALAFAFAVAIDAVLPDGGGLGRALALAASFGAIALLGKEIVARVPFPLDGVGGFSYARAKLWEETGPVFLGLAAVHLPDLVKLAT